MILVYELPEALTATVRKLVTDTTNDNIPEGRPFLVKLPKGSQEKRRALNLLRKAGVRFSMDHKEIWAMQVRQEVLAMLDKEDMLYNCSTYLSEKLNRNYAYLSAVFSEYFDITIEHYIISCRIEKAKAIMRAGNTKISDVARLLKYRSAAHFSYQFKQIEGIPPIKFKQQLKEKSNNKAGQ